MDTIQDFRLQTLTVLSVGVREYLHLDRECGRAGRQAGGRSGNLQPVGRMGRRTGDRAGKRVDGQASRQIDIVVFEFNTGPSASSGYIVFSLIVHKMAFCEDRAVCPFTTYMG